jgi:hypothetical protein
VPPEKLIVPVVPRASANSRLNVPALRIVPPEKVFVPLSTSVPEPLLVKPDPPETTPERVSCVPETSNVLLAPSPTFPLRLLVPVLVFKVPPFRTISSAPTATPCKSNVATLATVVLFPAIVPRPLALLIANVPLLIVVLPE